MDKNKNIQSLKEIGTSGNRFIDKFGNVYDKNGKLLFRL